MIAILAHYEYDAYLIYKDTTHPVVMNSIQLLEKMFNLRLRLPDRESSSKKGMLASICWLGFKEILIKELQETFHCQITTAKSFSKIVRVPV